MGTGGRAHGAWGQCLMVGMDTGRPLCAAEHGMQKVRGETIAELMLTSQRGAEIWCKDWD